MELKGKTALITGASRGIGRAIALCFLDAGARVIGTYRERSDLATQLESEYEQLSFVQLDVGDRDSVDRLARTLRDDGIRIDSLVNNAGINRPNDFDKISEEDWHAVVNTNLSGPYRVCQSLLPCLVDGGTISNIGSVSGQYGGPRTTHYAVTKAGLITFSQNLAIFLRNRGIRVNTISPGLIESEMAGAAKNLGVAEKILLGRMGRPEEVGHVAVFLASDRASYITAQVINVNGGLYF